MAGPILERETELSTLGAVGAGSVVLIAGEAGIGKSTLVDALPDVLPAGTRLLVGYCDDLATPRVLGPLRDLIGSVSTALTEALESGDRGRVFDALLAELTRPTVLVVEDVHWADEATLDVLRFLVRRIRRLPSALVLTYRNTDDQALRRLVGAAADAQRLRPARLSSDAVRRLGAHTGLDTAEVFAVTSGNPFFVTEVLASGDAGTVPRSVAEAVRGRLSHLSPVTRRVVEQLAVIPSAAEPWLVEAVVPGGVEALADAEQQGVLTVSPVRVAFGHELARRAVLDSLPAARRIAANRAVLAALLDHRDVDVSRIVHHAAEAGADDPILRFGPVAARVAAAGGAHRAAVAHYRLVLDRLAAYPPDEQADLVEAYAIECQAAGRAKEAVTAQEDAVRRRRARGDRPALGISLRLLSRMHWWAGSRTEADRCGAEAIELLESAGDEHALAVALSNQAQLHMLAGRIRDAIQLSERVAGMARALDDAGLLSHALNTLGTCIWPDGQAHLEESLEVALAAGEAEQACRAYVNLASPLIEDLRLDEALHHLDAGIAFAADAELLGHERYLRGSRIDVRLLRGEWELADHEARSLLDAEEPIVRCHARIVAGLVRVRSGRDGGEELLREAWDHAQELAEPQHVCPAGAALLESAWLRGDLPRAAAEAADVYRRLRGFGRAPGLAELEYWLHAGGVPVTVSGGPFALLSAGAWREATAEWEQAGCRYAAALAAAFTSDPDALLAGLRTADELGASPLAGRLRARLRELGVTRVPRGPQPATRSNPGGLTNRQADVVRLLADGLTNAEIADRLVLSVRTVDTHVAAALDKLGVRTRREAVSRARALGLG
ncbi:ATP-binding protein [Cryptosporangium arvum]|uniref:Transcriptional regulator, luxR family n=1 Tax=Cryptosporangium arvum DSM 44712 TaxID=927661 RepID=A0A010YK78_9ACTN|nr:AAA family ATPase [Cryptosporangium arvum]EXG80640.1 transcriptional regulator, luxR family [Cryptosporangium arvum DSM 44712]